MFFRYDWKRHKPTGWTVKAIFWRVASCAPLAPVPLVAAAACAAHGIVQISPRGAGGSTSSG